MGQSDIFDFLEMKYLENKESRYTKKEMEQYLGRKIKDRTLISMVKFNEIEREKKDLLKGHIQYRYRFVPK